MKILIKSVLLFLLTSPFLVYASYEDYYPNYFEFCSGTQLKYQDAYFDGAAGGVGGHGLFYIHGLCKDYSKDYPQVIPCDEVVDAKFPHKGVGISLDNDFKNVAWVAIPGYDLTFLGNKKDGEITTRDIQDVVDEATKLEVLKNVKMDSYDKLGLIFGTAPYEERASLASLGTDIAVSWARDLRCVRIPFEKEKLKEASDFLNELNQKYYLNNIEYDWSMLSNNCTHLAINTSHLLGLNKSIKTDQKFIKKFFNLAIPSNAYLNYVDQSVLKLKLGAIIHRIPVFKSSSIFKTDKLKAITIPRVRIVRPFATPKKYDRFLNKEEYSTLKGNAKAVKEKVLNKKSKQNLIGKDLEIIERILNSNEDDLTL